MKRTIASILSVFITLNVLLVWHCYLVWQAFVGSSATLVALFSIIYIMLAFGYLGAFYVRQRGWYHLFIALKKIGAFGLALQSYVILYIPFGYFIYGILNWGMNIPSADALKLVGAIFLIAFFSLYVYGYWNARQTRIRYVNIDVDKPSPFMDTNSITALVASDLHLGASMGRSLLLRLRNAVNQINPDLILFVGDVLDDSVEPYIRGNYSSIFATLQARLGVYAVLGNHEYYGQTIQRYKEEVEAIGQTLLLDEVAMIGDADAAGKLFIVGREDRAAGGDSGPPGLPKLQRKSVSTLVEPLPLDTGTIVVLDHQPYQLEVAEAAGVDVMLSGHTHAGQFWPWRAVTKRIYELDWGYVRKGAMHVIVSCGFGAWGPPIRIGTHSELVVLTMNFKPTVQQ